MVRQSGNTLINNNKSWAQIVMNSGVQQKLQQNNLQSKKAQSKTQKKQQTQTQRNNTQQLKQVKQYLDKSKTSVRQIKKFVSTTQYPLSISSAQLKALQQEYQSICNLFNANNYFGKSTYSQSKAWIQTRGRNVISVASCYSLRHKPVPNVLRPQQKRAMKGGMRFIPKQSVKKNQKSKSQQPKFGENKQSNWGAERAWGKNQPKKIREPSSLHTVLSIAFGAVCCNFITTPVAVVSYTRTEPSQLEVTNIVSMVGLHTSEATESFGTSVVAISEFKFNS